jgi:hypothetical protein
MELLTAISACEKNGLVLIGHFSNVSDRWRLEMKCKTIILYLVLFIFVSFEASAASQRSTINLQIVNGSISLDCKGVKLERLIEAISKRTGIAYKIYPDMKEKLITDRFESLNFREAFKKILGENYAIVYSSDKPEQIEKLYVLYKGRNNEKHELIEAYYGQVFPRMSSLKKVVGERVKAKHSEARFYEMIPYYNLDGKLISYVFTYYTGPGDIPEKKALKAEIMSAWKVQKRALDDIHKGYNERNSAVIIEAAAKSRKASLAISRENDFVTLKVGASYEIPPLLAFWNGLPLDISQYPRALYVANERLKDKAPEFKRTYTTGLFSIVFAFEGSDKKTYYVEPDNWTIFTSWKNINKGEDKKAKESDADKIKANRLKWADFLDI